MSIVNFLRQLTLFTSFILNQVNWQVLGVYLWFKLLRKNCITKKRVCSSNFCFHQFSARHNRSWKKNEYKNFGFIFFSLFVLVQYYSSLLSTNSENSLKSEIMCKQKEKQPQKVISSQFGEVLLPTAKKSLQ